MLNRIIGRGSSALRELPFFEDVSLLRHEMSMKEDREGELHRHFQLDPNASACENFAAYPEARLNVRMHPRFFYSKLLDSWLNRPRICVVRYQDTLANLDNELAHVSRFTGRRVDMDPVRATVEENSFAKQAQKCYESSQKPGEADDRKSLRRAVAGDWKNHFNARSCDLIWRLEGSSLECLGYEPESSWIAGFLSELETQGEAPLTGAESAS